MKNADADPSIREAHDDLYAEALEIVVKIGTASTSILQRRLNIGYARAVRLLDELEDNGIIRQRPGRPIWRVEAGSENNFASLLLRTLPSVATVAILILAANYYLVALPKQHQQLLRVKAEEACQSMLSRNEVNIADSDQADWKRHCIADKLSLWK